MKNLKSLFLIIYSIVILSGCSKSDNEYYEAAKGAIEKKEYAEALKNFLIIKNDFPESAHNAEAILEVAKLYHGKVDKNLSGEETFRKAVKNYKEFYLKYPDQKEATKALFMAGFISANELNKLDEAKKLYTEFLEKYPESELSFSVKIELENLGTKPDEILQKQLKSEELQNNE